MVVVVVLVVVGVPNSYCGWVSVAYTVPTDPTENRGPSSQRCLHYAGFLKGTGRRAIQSSYIEGGRAPFFLLRVASSR